MKPILSLMLCVVFPALTHAQFSQGTKLLSAGFSGSFNSNKNEATANVVNETFSNNTGVNVMFGKFYQEDKARGVFINYLNSTSQTKSGVIGSINEREQNSQNHYGSIGYFQNRYHHLGKQFYGIMGFTVAYRLDYTQTKTNYPYNSDPLVGPIGSSRETYNHNLFSNFNLGIGYLFHPKVSVQANVNVLSLGVGYRSTPSVKQVSGSYNLLNGFNINSVSLGFTLFL